ncbi:hypothetical protein [Winogradskyella psychrotolerans]|uniref:hypothetical protein n=1 Tax=Winogradskyella psychrotolerans TaxID=1344585 RepID=UPI001C06E386|nr:hypothetical protein [Winogradskyella psychrotolerans]MBU2929977.1 hypothetical protein [Winogradskyella psychrotolerans]
MNPKYKKIGIIAAIICTSLVVFTFIANTVIERKIISAVDDLPKSVNAQFTAVEASIWSGSLAIFSPEVIVKGETTNKTILDAKLKSIEINDVGYWNLLFNDKIAIESLVIDELVAKYKHNSIVKNKDYQSSFLDKVKQIIHADKIAITKADVLITNYESDSIILSIPNLNFEVLDFQINPKASKINKKITYTDFDLSAKDLMWATNEFDNLMANSIHVTNSSARFKGFKLKTKYSKAKYSTLLKKERDHFNMEIEEMKISDMDFGFDTDEKFYFKSSKIKLSAPYAEIYRDKLVTDDLTYKPLYGTSLRDLGFNLGINLVEITDGSISYLEKVNADKQAGRLDFNDLNATFSKLGNTFGNDDTVIQIRSTFMEDSPLIVDWNFKVADTTDQFTFKADLGLFNATQMDQFTQPNLQVDLNGELKQTYFTISGTPNTSRIDIKMKYDDFKVSILKKNGKEKNKFLSSLVNLFVSKDSEDDKNNFRYGQSEQVERETNKSVFNFIWLNIKAGLLSAMAGDGEKPDD